MKSLEILIVTYFCDENLGLNSGVPPSNLTNKTSKINVNQIMLFVILEKSKSWTTTRFAYHFARISTIMIRTVSWLLQADVMRCNISMMMTASIDRSLDNISFALLLIFQ